MSTAFSLPVIISLIGGYLLGSIPFGLLLTKAAGHGDIRQMGSGNIGATNVLRTGNKLLAAATLLLDILKGTVAVTAAHWFAAWWAVRQFAAQAAVEGATATIAPSHVFLSAAVAAGLGAFIGHVYPVWLGFKGGKGAATYIGVLIGLFWPAAVVYCVAWLLVAAVTRYSSVSSLVASIAAPLSVWAMGWPQIAIVLIPLSLLLIYKHKGNIERLLAGQEPKIGAKA